MSLSSIISVESIRQLGEITRALEMLTACSMSAADPMRMSHDDASRERRCARPAAREHQREGQERFPTGWPIHVTSFYATLSWHNVSGGSHLSRVKRTERVFALEVVVASAIATVTACA